MSTFHISLIRPYYPTNDAMFPNWVHSEPYDFGAPDGQEWFVNEIIGIGGKDLKRLNTRSDGAWGIRHGSPMPTVVSLRHLIVIWNIRGSRVTSNYQRGTRDTFRIRK